MELGVPADAWKAVYQTAEIFSQGFKEVNDYAYISKDNGSLKSMVKYRGINQGEVTLVC